MDRASLLAAMDSVAAEKPRLVNIHGLGEVHIREITIGEVDEQIADTESGKGKRGIARGACRLLADADGNRLLDPDDTDDVDKMAKLPLRVLTAINAAQELEGATKGK